MLSSFSNAWQMCRHRIFVYKSGADFVIAAQRCRWWIVLPLLVCCFFRLGGCANARSRRGLSRCLFFLCIWLCFVCLRVGVRIIIGTGTKRWSPVQRRHGQSRVKFFCVLLDRQFGNRKKKFCNNSEWLHRFGLVRCKFCCGFSRCWHQPQEQLCNTQGFQMCPFLFSRRESPRSPVQHVGRVRCQSLKSCAFNSASFSVTLIWHCNLTRHA